MSLLGNIVFALFHIVLGQYQYEEPLLYWMTMVVRDLGWVDIDLGCSTMLPGQGN